MTNSKSVNYLASALAKKTATLCLLFPYLLVAQAPPMQWQRTFGSWGNDLGWNVMALPGGGYALSGTVEGTSANVNNAHGGSDFWLIIVDSLGNQVWNKAYGGSASEECMGMFATPDKGFVLAGESISTDGDALGSGWHAYSDYWVIKVDSAGSMQWQRAYGGSTYEVARSVAATADGGYIVAGFSDSGDGDVSPSHGAEDCWIVKLDAGGNIQWQKMYGGSNEDRANHILQTRDHGFVFCGKSYSGDGDVSGHHGPITGFVACDYWVAKIDSAGNLLWQRSLGGTQDDEAMWIEQTADDGYVVTGWARSYDGDVMNSHGQSECLVVKLDKNGATQWSKVYGGSDQDGAYSIKQAPDNGFVFAGGTESNDGDVSGNHSTASAYDLWVVKTDSAGTFQWQKCIGGSMPDISYCMDLAHDGGYILSGLTQSTDGDAQGDSLIGGADMWIVKLAKDHSDGMEETGAPSFTMYPNPTAGHVSINGLQYATLVRVFNSLGEVLVAQKVSGARTQLDLEGFDNGIYFVEVRTTHQTCTRKLVLDR